MTPPGTKGRNEADSSGAHCKGADGTTEYAHNPRYCMILPDAAEPDEDNIASSSES